MKASSLFLILIIETAIVTLLQLVPVNINAELLTTNSEFVFGVIGSNNIAIIILLLFLVFFVYLTAKSKKAVYTLADILLIAGVASNLLDRAFRGGATDYISIGRLPTFNIADIFIIIGLIVLGVNYLTRSKEKTR